MDPSKTPKLTRRQRLKQRWLRHTHLEHVLGVLIVGLLALVVVLLVALSLESAPLEPAWGNVAEWAAVVVTFFGFVGAIAALRIQSRSVEIQDEQRREQVMDKSNAEMAKRVQGKAVADRVLKDVEKRLKDEREKYARSVDLQVKAEHIPPLPGRRSASDGQLALSVKAFFPESKEAVPVGPYTDNRLIIPDDKDLAGLNETISRTAEAKLGAAGFRDNLAWRVAGAGWFDGDDLQAANWLIPRAGVEFTDPNGIRWLRSGDQSLNELPFGESP